MASREIRGNLERLHDVRDFGVAHDQPDPRGWRVLSADGREIGSVDELIVDTAARKVMYLDCDLDETRLKLSGADRDRHILVPMDSATLNRSDRQVTVRGINEGDVLSLPAYRGGPLTVAMATQLTQRFGSRPVATRDVREAEASRRGSARQVDREGEERLTRSEEELDISKRMVEAGEVDVRKRVETEHVRQPVTRRREEVEVERHPMTGAAPGRIEEDEIRIPVREEEIIVEKRPMTKEEVVVKRRVVDEEVDVEADVRKERIDVERLGRKEGRGRFPERGEGKR